MENASVHNGKLLTSPYHSEARGYGQRDAFFSLSLTMYHLLSTLTLKQNI